MSTMKATSPRGPFSLPRRRRAVVALVATLLLALAIPTPASAGVSVPDEIRCLALTIYFEARGEPDAGKVGVGHVVMNRVGDPKFPSRVCAVVRQGGEWPRNRCQFSWWCDGRSDKPRNHAAWKISKLIAQRIYWGFSQDPTGGALWYHATYVKPSWRKAFERGPTLGQHTFYRRTNARLASTTGLGAALP